MSFILDALKKSESERQRQTGPALFEVKMAPPRMGGLPWWVIVVAALLFLNFVVVAWVLWRRPDAPPSVPVPSEAAAVPSAGNVAPAMSSPSARAVVPVPPTPAWGNAPAIGPAPTSIGVAPEEEFNPADYEAALPAEAAPNRSVARDVSNGGVTAPSAATPPVAPSVSASRGPTLVRPASEGGTTRGPEAVQAATASNDFPTIAELPPAVANQLPELKLDLHSYSRSAKDRFVFINMRRLNEGDVLPEGVRVEAITPDGAVLSFRNNRFVLERN